MNNITGRAANIKLAVFDVDGVLSDGQLYYDATGDAIKAFHARDGIGLKALLNAGIEVAIITGRNSKIVSARMAGLGITHVYQGSQDKIGAWKDLLGKLNITEAETAMMGDDLPDLALLKRAGLAACPADAHECVLDHVHLKVSRNGGFGAARELADVIVAAQSR
jgi:3-deoxy-D-manno-octulosonate 8-phosphate phosphatase (KDO 8-P phosphatase)